MCFGSMLDMVLDNAPKFLCMTSSVNRPIKILTSSGSLKVSPNFLKTSLNILAVETSPFAKMSVIMMSMIFCTSNLIRASTKASSVFSPREEFETLTSAAIKFHKNIQIFDKKF